MSGSAGIFVSIKEAAEIMSTTETKILMLLRQNQIKGKQQDECWHIDKASLLAYEKPADEPVKAVHRCGGCGGGCSSI